MKNVVQFYGTTQSLLTAITITITITLAFTEGQFTELVAIRISGPVTRSHALKVLSVIVIDVLKEITCKCGILRY